MSKEVHIYDGFEIPEKGIKGFTPDRLIIDKQTISNQKLYDILRPILYAMLNNK